MGFSDVVRSLKISSNNLKIDAETKREGSSCATVSFVMDSMIVLNVGIEKDGDDWWDHSVWIQSY